MGELNRHNPEQQGLIQELFECVKVREDDTNKPEETTKKLKAYYSKYFKKDKTALSLFIIKLWLDLMIKNGNLDETKKGVLTVMRTELGNSSYPAPAYRFPGVPEFFRRHGPYIEQLLEK